MLDEFNTNHGFLRPSGCDSECPVHGADRQSESIGQAPISPSRCTYTATLLMLDTQSHTVTPQTG